MDSHTTDSKTVTRRIFAPPKMQNALREYCLGENLVNESMQSSQAWEDASSRWGLATSIAEKTPGACSNLKPALMAESTPDRGQYQGRWQ
jgi:hypothetical protein